MAKKGRTSEIIFASLRFPEHIAKITEAYEKRSNYNTVLKKKKSLFNGLSFNAFQDLRIALDRCSEINIKLKEIDDCFFQIVKSRSKSVKIREQKLKKGSENVSDEDFETAKSLIEETLVLEEVLEKYINKKYSSITLILEKVENAKIEVLKEIEFLEKVSQDPSTHFRSIYKDLT